LAAQLETARAVAVALRDAARPGGPIVAVSHPDLDEHPDRELARRQMTGGGGVVSFEVAGGLEAAIAAFDRFELVGRAPSLGGVETLASLPAHTTHAALTAQQRAALSIPDGLVRLSVGLEGADAIVADVLRAVGEGGSLVDPT
jgi:cystathionine beta-lyase/cystathionine gamma-synthase